MRKFLSDWVEFYTPEKVYDLYRENTSMDDQYIITEAEIYYEESDLVSEHNKAFVLDQFGQNDYREEYDTFKEAFDKVLKHEEKVIEKLVNTHFDNPFRFNDLLHYGAEISVYQLAKETGIPQQTLNRYSNAVTNINNMPIEMASKVAEFLDMTLDEFWEEVK